MQETPSTGDYDYPTSSSATKMRRIRVPSSLSESARCDRLTAPTPPNRERDHLIEKHQDYVHAIAARVRRDLACEVELEELVAYGMKGLVEAAERYDPSRGAAFTTFSYYRIRGAMFDGLRKIGWLGRREYARFQAAANDLMENQSQRQIPAEAENAATACDSLAQSLDNLATIFVTSLDAVSGSEPQDSAPDPAAIFEHNALRKTVRQAVARLPAKERSLIELYYFKGITLDAAGKQLGLSKSWASRLHARAVGCLSQELSQDS